LTKKAYEAASYFTPNPGGVGPMTVAMIIDNLIEMKEGEK
jgi:methylenetetrahydrofolate dehydrogenase (NADP+)/methenyltetrahydrofolate cyclohydrolase